SKTSTGNIELEYMKISFSELVNQCSAEYEDKFAEAGLELVKSINDEGSLINVDGRRVFRIIDNILNNAVKYAQPGTRVYLDLVKRDDELILSLKNTSKEMLNISAEELTERFVRGDRSRNTEGSGLGLSIARNLTELQGGRFEITVDGDLFKVDVVFPIA
ncbi:MAG: GHKL domain-containing protein, partial [Eubacterium sp.]|nr:GHKL domain-containing protein [Eubacterium sp.]